MASDADTQLQTDFISKSADHDCEDHKIVFTPSMVANLLCTRISGEQLVQCLPNKYASILMQHPLLDDEVAAFYNHFSWDSFIAYVMTFLLSFYR